MYSLPALRTSGRITESEKFPYMLDAITYLRRNKSGSALQRRATPLWVLASNAAFRNSLRFKLAIALISVPFFLGRVRRVGTPAMETRSFTGEPLSCFQPASGPH